MRRLLAILLLLAATATGAAAGAGSPAPGVSIGWDGQLSVNKDVRYVAIPSRGDTVLQKVKVNGGRVLGWRTIKGLYGVPFVAFDSTVGGLTPDGKTLVLASHTLKPASFLLVDTKRLRVQQTIRLPGRFAFDAVSPDARLLYLVEFLAADGARYNVRVLDMATGKLRPKPVVDPNEKGAMNGFPMTRATSPDGTWAYTLYTRQGAHPFVHALDTGHARAKCLDLPHHMNLNGVKLRVDGKRLLLVRRGATVKTIALPG